MKEEKLEVSTQITEMEKQRFMLRLIIYRAAIQPKTQDRISPLTMTKDVKHSQFPHPGSKPPTNPICSIHYFYKTRHLNFEPLRELGLNV